MDGCPAAVHGLAVGVAGAVSLTPLVRGLLFGVPAHDPVTLALVALTTAVGGIGACWIPAFRAARIDPADALHAG